MYRFVRPGTITLTITDGDTLTVRTRLTHGERTDAYERQYVPDAEGKPVFKPGQIRLSMVTAYLVDWSLTDEKGDREVIAHQPVEVVEGILRNLSPEDFDEIYTAIREHEQKGILERAWEKKTGDRRRSDLALAIRCHWRVDWVRELDELDYEVLCEMLTEADHHGDHR